MKDDHYDEMIPELNPYNSGENMMMEEEYYKGPRDTGATVVLDPASIQIAGTHYKDMAIQPMDFSFANGFDCYQFSVLKYISRHKTKGGSKDLKKAIHCAMMYLKAEYGEVFDPEEKL